MLDEPFSGVDPLAVIDIQKIISQLREEDGLALLITDHNVRETLQIVDRAYLLIEGRVILEGPSERLVDDPIAKQHYLGENFQM
jgi:lipopolysaccharide export system ATP-binding protein